MVSQTGICSDSRGCIMSPDRYWNIFLVAGGSIMIIYVVLLYPLGYFVLLRPFDRRFKKLGMETIELLLPKFHNAAFRTLGYACYIVLEPWRGKKIKNRVFARYLDGNFKGQVRMFGPVNFRKKATRFQVFVAYFIIYGFIWSLSLCFLYAVHNFVLFPEFTKVRSVE